MSNEAKNHFAATFDHGRKGGVKTSVTHQGSTRIAFPDKRGPQPKDGETWSCFVIGENKDKTVWFVRCIRLVGAKPKAEVSVQKAAKKPFGFAPATAQDAELRAGKWLVPAANSARSVLEMAIAVAHRQAAGDESARAIQKSIVAAQASIADTHKREGAQVARLRRLAFISNEGIKNVELLITMRGMRENLAKGDRLYASMCSQIARLKQQAEKDGDKVDLPYDLEEEQMQDFKLSLDRMRAHLLRELGQENWNGDKVTIPKVMNKLERKVMQSIDGLWSDANDALAKVNEVVGAIESIFKIHHERQALLSDLASLVNQYEARLAALVS